MVELAREGCFIKGLPSLDLKHFLFGMKLLCYMIIVKQLSLLPNPLHSFVSLNYYEKIAVEFSKTCNVTSKLCPAL